MPETDNRAPRRARVGGSGFTVFTINFNDGEGPQPLGIGGSFARQVAHTSPPPVGPGAVPIQPLDAVHPIEIITPAATSMGQVTLELYELYGGKVWDKLGKITRGANDLAEVFRRVANTPNDIKMVKRVEPPKGSRIDSPYTEIYHRCVITNVADGETIEVGTMEILKQVTIGYTHMTRND